MRHTRRGEEKEEKQEDAKPRKDVEKLVRKEVVGKCKYLPKKKH